MGSRWRFGRSGWRRRRFIEGLAVLAVLGAVAIAFRADLLHPVHLKEFLVSFGALAPVIWVLLYVVAVFVPYATTVMTIAAGLAFGTLAGTILAYFAAVLFGLLPFTVSRRLGREWVEAKVGSSGVRKYAGLINRHAFLVVFYLRLIPSFPYEIQNYIAGVTRIGYVRFMLATALGIGPILFILAFLGDSLTDPGSARFWMAAGIWLAAVLAPAVVGLVRRRLGKPPIFERPGS